MRMFLLGLLVGCADLEPTPNDDATRAPDAAARIGCALDHIEVVEDPSVPSPGFERAADTILAGANGRFAGVLRLQGGAIVEGELEAARGHEIRALRYVWVDRTGDRSESTACPPAYQLDFAGSLSASQLLDEVFTSVLQAPDTRDPSFMVDLPLESMRGSLPLELDPSEWTSVRLEVDGSLRQDEWEGTLTWVATRDDEVVEEHVGDFLFEASQ